MKKNLTEKELKEVTGGRIIMKNPDHKYAPIFPYFPYLCGEAPAGAESGKALFPFIVREEGFIIG